MLRSEDGGFNFVLDSQRHLSSRDLCVTFPLRFTVIANHFAALSYIELCVCVCVFYTLGIQFCIGRYVLLYYAWFDFQLLSLKGFKC